MTSLKAMDTTTVRQSHKQPALCTIIVDGYEEHHKPSSATQQPEHHWRLPNTDPRNEGKYLFRLHTLDIYFWTADDANKFMNAIEKKLEPGQVEILHKPAPPVAHDAAMSPLVQNLENVAIQDPAYRNGQTRNSRATLAGPATIAGQTAHAARSEQATPTAKDQDPAVFQPLAYNPAAPAAPEPIKHREKTPPPVDADSGTGLASAAARDHAQAMSLHKAQPYSPYGQPSSAQGYVSPMPSLSHTSPPPTTGFSGPPSVIPGQRTSSVSSFPGPPSQSGRSTASPHTPTPAFASPSPTHQNATPPSSQQLTTTFSPPPQPPAEHAPFYTPNSAPDESPATEILGTSYVASHRQPLQHLQPQYAQFSPQPERQNSSSSSHSKPEPIGGYSTYSYEQQQPHHHHHHQAEGSNYDIHNQVYRPTPEEYNKHNKPSKAASTMKPVGSPAGKLEEQAGRVDKGVNRFFKKLEKRIG